MRPEHARGRDAYAPGRERYRADGSWRNEHRYGRSRGSYTEDSSVRRYRAPPTDGEHNWRRYPRRHYDGPEKKRRRASLSPPPASNSSRSASAATSTPTPVPTTMPPVPDPPRRASYSPSASTVQALYDLQKTTPSVRGVVDRAHPASHQRWRPLTKEAYHQRNVPAPPFPRRSNPPRSVSPPIPPLEQRGAPLAPLVPPEPGPPPKPPSKHRLVRPDAGRSTSPGRWLQTDAGKSTMPSSSTVLDEPYEIVAQVGEGTYGQVYKASAGRHGRLVALKKIRMENAREGFPVTSMREMKLLQALRHENVIRLHETMTSRTGSVYMVFEYMEHDLNGILVHPDVDFSASHVKSLASQLLHGLAYLHGRAVLHRDLKGSNLLLNSQGTLKIADFGLARTYSKRKPGDYTNRVVTLWYRPPELLLGATRYGAEVDAWGAGCLFLELFRRQAVFQGRDEIHQLHVITQTLGPLTASAWPSLQHLPWYELMRLEDSDHADTTSTPVATTPTNTNDTPMDHDRDVFVQQFGSVLSHGAMELARGLLTYDPDQRWSANDALGCAYFTTEAPVPEKPAQYVSMKCGVDRCINQHSQAFSHTRWRMARNAVETCLATCPSSNAHTCAQPVSTTIHVTRSTPHAAGARVDIGGVWPSA